jgi:hypothetical protein
MKSRRFGTVFGRVFLKAREASGRIERACRRAVAIRGLHRLPHRGVTHERREGEAYFYMENDSDIRARRLSWRRECKAGVATVDTVSTVACANGRGP